MHGVRSDGANVELAPRLSQVARSRHWTADRLDEWGLGGMADSVVLVVSELVTNAIVASAAASGGLAGSRPREVTLSLYFDGETLRVEVGDQCVGALPESRASAPDDEEGRGLQVVAALCKQWGCRETADGKIVWCELSTRS